MTFTPQELHLVRLLGERFDVHALCRWLAGRSGEAPLRARLRGLTAATPLVFAAHAVRALAAAGLIDRPLFAGLVAERAPLAGEIWGVAALFGVAHPDAAPVAALPEQLATLAEAALDEPCPRPFVGPAEPLDLLRAETVCVVQGVGGVGKSARVERFYADHQARFPGGQLKITLHHDAAPTADALLNELAERLGVLQGPGPMEDRVRGAALAARPLLHLDDLDAEPQAQAAVALARRLPDLPIVLSGRAPFADAPPGWGRVVVEPLLVTDALTQLAAELTPKVAVWVDDDARRALVAALEGLPLAIHLAASYLNAGHKARALLQALAAAHASQTSRGERALCAMFEVSLSALRWSLRGEMGELAKARALGVAALGLAPRAGVGRSWMEAIVGAPSVTASRWVSCAVTLSIVQHDPVAERWWVNNSVAALLREVLQAADLAASPALVTPAPSPPPPSPPAPAPPPTTPGLWDRLLAWLGLRSTPAARVVTVDLEGDRVETNARRSGAAPSLTARAVARMDTWVLERLPLKPDQTREARWDALRAESDAVREWLSVQRGSGAVVCALRGADYALVFGPVSAWLELTTQALAVTTHARERSTLLWSQSNLARAAGDLSFAVYSAKQKSQHDAVQSWAKEVALAAGLRADILMEQGRLDEAIFVLNEEVLPVLMALGDLHALAASARRIVRVHTSRRQFEEALSLMRWVLGLFEAEDDEVGRGVTLIEIADVLHAQGAFDEAARLQREVALPIFQSIGDLHAQALTLGRLAGALHAQGRLDEAIQIRREEELPTYIALGKTRDICVAQINLAQLLLRRGHPGDTPEALTLFTTVYERAVELGYAREAEHARAVLHTLSGSDDELLS